MSDIIYDSLFHKANRLSKSRYKKNWLFASTFNPRFFRNSYTDEAIPAVDGEEDRGSVS